MSWAASPFIGAWLPILLDEIAHVITIVCSLVILSFQRKRLVICLLWAGPRRSINTATKQPHVSWMHCMFIISLYKHVHVYVNIYGPARRPATPPPRNHTGGRGKPSTTIRQDLICYTYTLAWATYSLHNRIPPCSVHLSHMMCPYNLFTAYSCPCSTFIVTHMLYIHASHVLPLHYLHAGHLWHTTQPPPTSQGEG